ncbi:MAG: hypothetical protein KGL38_07990 [Gemmatimonadota bacterium]|nr:hypothetical protein [Gemmatimonadota bacterium]
MAGGFAADPRRSAPLAFGRIVVVGGGCYGSYYVRQLRRAAAADAVVCDEIVVVDRDPACAVARERMPGDALVRVEIAEWRAWFDRALSAARSRGGDNRDAIVPSPLMPHLLRDWLLDAARARWPRRAVAVGGLDRPPDVPWERPGADGTHYVSFATWTCPINCIEPAVCPHTRGPRDWSLAPAIRDWAARRGAPAPGPFLFRCTHRAYGVGMVDVRDVLAADAAIAAAGADGSPVDVVVGTVSHCHGALSRVVVAPAAR